MWPWLPTCNFGTSMDHCTVHYMTLFYQINIYLSAIKINVPWLKMYVRWIWISCTCIVLVSIQNYRTHRLLDKMVKYKQKHDHECFRGETIWVHHDTIHITIQSSRYDTYRDMLFTCTWTAENWKNILIFGSQILQLEINLWIMHYLIYLWNN